MLLFICTGNTCRSPMAAALARKMGWDAQSAGLYPVPGASATLQAQRAAGLHGADLSRHRAQPVTLPLLRQAEHIYVMTAGHAQIVLSLFPECAGRLSILSPQIPDPFGGDDRDYAHCAQMILDALKNAGLKRE